MQMQEQLGEKQNVVFYFSWEICIISLPMSRIS